MRDALRLNTLEMSTRFLRVPSRRGQAAHALLLWVAVSHACVASSLRDAKVSPPRVVDYYPDAASILLGAAAGRFSALEPWTDVMIEGTNFSHRRLALTPEHFARGLANGGDAGLFARAHARLARGQCLHVLAIGGSLSCGNLGGTDDTQPRGRLVAWPAALQVELNARFPCGTASPRAATGIPYPPLPSAPRSPDGGGGHDREALLFPPGPRTQHVVLNHALYGVGSDVWIDKVAGWLHAQRHGEVTPLTGVDVVVVETVRSA